MEKIYFYTPTKVFFEKGAIEKYLPLVKEFGKKILLVSGRNFIYKTGLANRIKEILEKEKIQYSFFSQVKPEPDVENVEKGVDFCIKEKCDVIVAIGGGSAIDVGKCIAVRVKNEGSIKDYFGEVEYKNNPLPIIAIPTTCGTGSEVTRYAVIVDNQLRTKKTVSNEKIMPLVAICDPLVVNFLPSNLIAATGMDAFCHSAESYLATSSDSISKMFSIESLKLLKENLLNAVKGDNKSREKVFLASTIAGYAINKTGTIIVHGMGYSLTIKYGIHHGTANSLFLPYAFQYLKENNYKKEIEEIENVVGRIEGLKEFIKKIGLPTRLSEIGVKEKDIEELAYLSEIGCERAIKKMKILLTKKDFFKIIKSAL